MRLICMRDMERPIAVLAIGSAQKARGGPIRTRALLGALGGRCTLKMKRWPAVLNRASPLLSALATAKVKGDVL